MDSVSSQSIKRSRRDHYFDVETQFFAQGLIQLMGPNVLCMGDDVGAVVTGSLDYPMVINLLSEESWRQHLKTRGDVGDTQFQFSLPADFSYLPIESESVASVLLPHSLEKHHQPHAMLREVHRVLQSEGVVVISGFNRFSLLGLQALISRSLARNTKFYSIARVIDWLRLLDLEILRSEVFHYGPVLYSEKLKRYTSFLESIGNRWLPMFAGGYVIVARKRQPGMKLVNHGARNKKRLQSVVSTAATRSLTK